MVTFGPRVVVHLVIAVAATAAAIWLFVAAQIPVKVAPVAKGQPTLYLTAYDGASLAQAFVLLSVAGLFLVLGVSRGVRDHRAKHCPDTP